MTTEAKAGRRQFVVVGEVTISVHATIEALDEEQAREVAAGQPIQRLCHQCGNHDGRDEWVTSGELDGEVTITHIEETK